MRVSTVVLSAALATTLASSGFVLMKHRTALSDANARIGQLEQESQQSAGTIRDRTAEVDALKLTVTKLEGEKAAQQRIMGDKDRALGELGSLKARSQANEAQLAKIVAQFKKLIDAGKLQVETRHGRLVLVMQNDVLFDEASTKIKPQGQAALEEVAATLKTVQGKQFMVVGHTDSMPVKTAEFTSNWDLSTARALAVLRLLVDNGVPPAVLSATGRAEFEPRAPNGHPFGRAKNRRIEIVLELPVADVLRTGATLKM
jgi:chemotaxis protein MotB